MMLPQLQIDLSIFIIYLYYGLKTHLLFTVLYLSFGISGFLNSQKLFYFSRSVPMDFFKSNYMILYLYVYFFSCLSNFFVNGATSFKYLVVIALMCFIIGRVVATNKTGWTSSVLSRWLIVIPTLHLAFRYSLLTLNSF